MIADPALGIRRRTTLGPAGDVAALARALHRAGYDDEGLGHISVRQPDGTLLVNPLEVGWDELLPGDVMRIDLDGNIVDGRWTVTPAIRLHLDVYAARDDVGVVVHNHPRWATVWADVGRIPPIFDQTGAVAGDDVALLAEYDGSVAEAANSNAAVDALGAHSTILLANHGVLVAAPAIQEAHLRAVTLEWRARQAWRVLTLDPAAAPLADHVVELVRSEVAAGRRAPLWEMAIARELRAEPRLAGDAQT